MLYNNLIFFLVVIFIFSTNTPAESPGLPKWIGVAGILSLLWLFSKIARRLYAKQMVAGSSARYFSVEKRLSVLAVVFFALFVYLFDLKFYLQVFSFQGKLPVLENIAGLGVFFLLLGLMWVHARPLYEKLFQCRYSPVGFILLNIKTNLPIVLPWLTISFLFDIIGMLPVPGVRQWLLSPWGDLLLFSVFICFLTIIFPPLVRYLWNCRPMEQGPVLERIHAFCRKQNFHSEILLWPLYEGQVVTAGIMGIVPGLRYLLVTPALLESLDEDELESVLAHEIGHVKKKHLVLYVFLFLGFSVFAGALATPLYYLIPASDFYYTLLSWTDLSAKALHDFLSGIPMLALLLIYFRFIFGFFIRNFERQADAFVFSAHDTGRPLVRSFKKIALLTGIQPEKKNWHHFGIGERIGFLEKCEVDKVAIGKHDRKVQVALVAYFVMIVVSVVSLQRFDLERLSKSYEIKYAEAVLLQKARLDPGNSLWPALLGEFMQDKKMEAKALAAWEQALKLKPTSAKVNNNLAWLLLTARDKSIRDASRALTLAQTAAMLHAEGFILDTLAMAFWANGFVEEAVATEVKAIKQDPENKHYYIQQIELFTTSQWGG